MVKDDWPPPYEYLGRPTAWLRVVRDYGEPVPHRHACPECYEHWNCWYGCTLEPDLEDQGVAFGSHYECEPCRKLLAMMAAKQAQIEAGRRAMIETQRESIEATMRALGA